MAVCTFSLATNEKWKDKSGKWQERVEWHNIVIYRQVAEYAGKNFKKGDSVFLEGKIQSRKYKAKDGLERTVYEIVCHDARKLGMNAPETVSALPTDYDDDVPF
jgi:single-strand DNA-binding protein